MFFNNLNAQETYELSGNVSDKSGEPVAFANTLITELDNDKILEGSVTDENGDFSIRLKRGEYLLKVTYLGFTTWEKQISITDSDIKLKIKLESATTQLNEVVISAKRQLISRKGDKLIMNIRNNAFAQGRSAAEILKYAPNVWVDQNTNIISLKGINAKILINGRESNLSSENLMSYLKGLTNEELESIEIISNPSAKYDAEGLGGIINIITNKKATSGFGGNIYSTSEFSRLNSYSTSGQFKTRLSKTLSFNTFLLYQENNNLSFEKRKEVISTPLRIYDYEKIDTSGSKNLFANIDFSYNPTEKDELIFEYRVLDNNNNNIQNNDLIIRDVSKIPSQGFYSRFGSLNYYALGFNYSKKIDSLGQNFNVIVDYYNSDSENKNKYQNLFLSENQDSIIDSNIRRSLTTSTFNIFSSQIDYGKPSLNKNLEFGAKFSVVDNKSTSLFENLMDGQFITDENFTNSFAYNELISALYGSYTIDDLFDSQLNFQIGIRGEYTKGIGEIAETGYESKRDYFDIFPSIFLTKKLNVRSTLAFSFSRRINRPDYSRFNPTIFYLTDFTSQVGNPDLEPSYTNAFEVNLNSSDLNLQLYLNDINGEGREILTRISNTELRYQWRNIDETIIYGLSLSYNRNIFKWWTIFVSSNWYGKEYRSFFNDAVDNIHVKKGTIQFRLASQFKLPFKIKSNVSFEYNGPEIFGQFESGSNYAFYLDFSRRVVKNLSLSVKVVDPFDMLRYRFANTQQGYQTTQFRNNFNRSIRFSLRYNFNLGGKTKNVNYKRSSQSLKNRAN